MDDERLAETHLKMKNQKIKMLKDNLEYIHKINYFIIFNGFNTHIYNIQSYFISTSVLVIFSMQIISVYLWSHYYVLPQFTFIFNEYEYV